MKKIAIVGYLGRMGSEIYKILSKQYKIIGIGKNDNLNLAHDCDLVVDFSTGFNSAKTAIWCQKNQKKLIIGATGQSFEENNAIFEASKNIAILKAGNFSLGISYLKKMLKVLKYEKVDDVAILEKHHKNKKDAPSGTAIELENKLKELFDCDVQTAYIRGGEEIGTHEVCLYFGSETLKISHQAFSRKAFAEGVCFAVGVMLNVCHAGLYSLEDII